MDVFLMNRSLNQGGTLFYSETGLVNTSTHTNLRESRCLFQIELSFRGYLEGETLPQIDKNIIAKESNYNRV